MFGGNKGSKSPRYNHGPLVKSGPTRGKNRSRNSGGRWRSKRSDAGSSRKGGCFITTAACEHMGRPDNCHELTTLRSFRDQHLLATAEGRAIVRHYYQVAPGVAERLRGRSELEAVWRVVTSCVQAIEDGRYDDATHAYMEMVRSLEEGSEKK